MIANRVDYIRYNLLEQHGGIWFDFSTLLFDDLNWLYKILNGEYD